MQEAQDTKKGMFSVLYNVKHLFDDVFFMEKLFQKIAGCYHVTITVFALRGWNFNI